MVLFIHYYSRQVFFPHGQLSKENGNSLDSLDNKEILSAVFSLLPDFEELSEEFIKVV